MALAHRSSPWPRDLMFRGSLVRESTGPSHPRLIVARGFRCILDRTRWELSFERKAIARNSIARPRDRPPRSVGRCGPGILSATLDMKRLCDSCEKRIDDTPTRRPSGRNPRSHQDQGPRNWGESHLRSHETGTNRRSMTIQRPSRSAPRTVSRHTARPAASLPRRDAVPTGNPSSTLSRISMRRIESSNMSSPILGPTSAQYHIGTLHLVRSEGAWVNCGE